MARVKPGLGRGLDALIKPQDYVKNENEGEDFKNLRDDDGKQVDILAKISVDFISRNPYQPRTSFNPEAMEELKRSILSNGLIQPITVRRTPDHMYQLISGERRLKACKEIGYKEIPAYIIKVESEELMLALALIENIQREKLNPIENIKNMFKLKTFVELIKSVLKIAGALILIYTVIYNSIPQIISTAAIPIAATAAVFGDFLVKVIIRVEFRQFYLFVLRPALPYCSINDCYREYTRIKSSKI